MRPPLRSASSQAGFSLVEMLVTLAVMSLLTVGILGVFDFNNKVARVQTQVADMQQSLRVAQYEMVRQIRMAGRGGVPTERAVEIRNNAGLTGTQETILVGQDSPLVVRGSDVITLRGVFSSPVYHLNYVATETFEFDADTGAGRIIVRDPGPTGVPQDMQPIREMMGLDGGSARREALLLMSPLSDAILAVVEFNPEDSSLVTDDTGTGTITTATIAFRVTGGDHADEMALLVPGGGGGVMPMINAVTVGILEEYRFYLRDFRPPAGAAGSPMAPKLSVARVFPGTEVAYRDNPDNLQLDLADNILDLQAALGLDRDADGDVEGAPLAATANEWMFDDPDDVAFTGRLGYLRVNTLARTDRPDRDYRAPPLEPLEDRVYEDGSSDLNDPAGPEVYYRRRLLQTIVDLRNLG